jgi:hypothetical protein
MEGPAQEAGASGRGARECAIDLMGGENDSYAPFVPTSLRQIDRIIELCSLVKDDMLCDLGCGDGAMLRRCAHATGCKTIGVEVDGALVHLARSLLAQEDLLTEPSINDSNASSGNPARHLVVEALVAAFCDTDTRFPDCTVIFLHLVEPQLVALTPFLRLALQRRGTRIVAQRFAIPGLQDQLLASIPSEVDASDSYFGSLGEAFLYGSEDRE